ncbi:MAG TPA: hypothetical protein VGD78_10095 [Chthoniobacterales bacterium]
MKISPSYALGLLALILTGGCHSRQGPSVLFRPATAGERPVTAQQVSSGHPASLGSLASVRDRETVKVYGINRYVDPADGRVMHERHAVYRLEQPAGWVLRQPDHAGEVLLGPVLGLKRAEYRPEPIPGETAQALAQQRRALEEAAAGVGGLQDSQRQLADSLLKLGRESADAQQKLTAIVTVLNERVKRLENDPQGKSENGPGTAEGSSTPPAGAGGMNRNPE